MGCDRRVPSTLCAHHHATRGHSNGLRPRRDTCGFVNNCPDDCLGQSRTLLTRKTTMTLKTTIKCETCNKTIRDARPNQRFDSDACRKQAQRKRKADRKAAFKEPEFATMVDAYAALTVRLRRRLHQTPGDVAQRELNRAVDLLVSEMEARQLTRRSKLEATVDRETATASQYVSDFENVTAMMSEKTKAAANRRVTEAMREVKSQFKELGDAVCEDEPEERFEAAYLKNYETFLRAEDISAFVARCDELFASVGYDYDQTPLVANLALEELDARDSIRHALEGTSNSFALKSQALRRRKLERALGLDAATVERVEGHTSSEAGLLKAFMGELSRSPEELARESEADSRAKLSSSANLYELGILEGPPPSEIQAEISRRNSEKGDDTPMLRDVLRSSDVPF